MATQESIFQVQEAYLAYYGRPADPIGLAFWVERLDEGAPIEELIASFGSSTQPEFQAIYGGELSGAEFFAIAYRNILNRDVDEAGLTFWVGVYDSYIAQGISADEARARLVLEFVEGIEGGSEADQATWAGQLQLANLTTELAQELERDVDINALINFVRDGALLGRSNLDTEAGLQAETAAIQDYYYSLNGGSDRVFTLVPVQDAGAPGEAPERVVYWGYNPDTDSGVPLDELLSFVSTITGLDFAELGLIDDDGVSSLAGLTSLTISNALNLLSETDNTSGNDGQQTPVLSIEHADGTVSEYPIEAELGELYIQFLRDLLFDENGQSRLYEVEVGGSDPVAPTPQAIRLTPTENNGGTLEDGNTGTRDDIIVASELVLLNGAYIDGGTGYNTLEVDARGSYARATALQNIQEVRVHNVANPADSDSNASVLDLSRATALERLVVTEGAAGGDLGELVVLGLRNGAALSLEGSFSRPVTLHYGQGVLASGVDLELNLGDTQNPLFDLNVSHNSSTLNIQALGGENWINDAHLGGQLRFLNVTGEGSLTIEGNLAESFIDSRPAVIDASSAGGVQLTFDGQAELQFSGGDAADMLTALNAANVQIDAGAGNNRLVVDGSANAVVSAADGNNQVSADDVGSLQLALGDGDNSVSALGGESVQVTTGDGDNQLQLSAGNVVLTTGAGNDQVVLASPDQEALVTVQLGGGNNTLIVGHEGQGLVALDGSVIDGEAVSLRVAADSDLSRASLAGVAGIVLEGALTLTAEQVSALGAEAFSVHRASFGETQNLHIIVTEDTVLSELLDLDTLGTSVRLNIDLRNGAELTLSAQELHEHVAWQGIDASDGLNGSVVITNAGTSFDPFDAGNDYQVVDGGSLTDSFDTSENVEINDGPNGYNRPSPEPSSRVLTINSDELPVVEDIYDDNGNDEVWTALSRTLKIVGSQDVTFTVPVDLSDDGYNVDFAAFAHNVNGLSLADFQDMQSVRGNGTAERFVRVDVQLSGEPDALIEVGEPGEGGGFDSRGVQSYVVTAISDSDGSFSDHEEATLHLGDSTRDVEVLGLRGNFNATLNLLQVNWGVDFLLEGDGRVNSGPQSLGHPAYSNVGVFNAEFAYSGATATVLLNNQGVATDRPLKVAGLNIANASTLDVQVDDADAIIDGINTATAAGEFLDGRDAGVETLRFSSANDVTVNGPIALEGLEALDASAVAGTFALQLSGDNDLSGVALSGVDAVSLADAHSSLTLTHAQLEAIGSDAISGNGTLTVLLADGAFDSSALDPNLQLHVVAQPGSYALDATTELSAVDELFVGSDTQVTLTADQFLQLSDTLVHYTGSGSSVHVVGVNQAHVDAGLEQMLLVTTDLGLAGSVALSEDVTLSATTLNAAAQGGFTLLGDASDLRVNVVMDGANADAGSNVVGTDPVNGVRTDGIATFMVTQLDTASADVFYVCNDTVGLETLGLQGNGGDSIHFAGIKRGVSLLLEGDGAANWSDVEKDDLTPDFSSIGAVQASYFTPGATAVIDINNQGVELGTASGGGERALLVDRLMLDNVAAAVLTVEDGDAVIGGLASDSLTSLSLSSVEDLLIEGVLPASLESFDASAVAGQFAATLSNMEGAFSLLTGADAAVSLDGVEAVMGTSIDGSAGNLALTVTASDLSAATLSGVDSVQITEGSELTLSADQVVGIGASAISGSVAAVGNAHETLNITGLSDQLIDANSFGADVRLGEVTVAAGTYTLDPATDLSGATVLVPANATVTMTADQYMALADIDGIAAGATVNVTGLTQAHVDAGFSLAGVADLGGSVALAEDVNLLSSTDLNGFSVVLADNQTLGLATRAQADGLQVGGGSDTTVVYLFATGWDPVADVIDGSGYAVDLLRLSDALVSQHDVELIQNLPSGVTVSVFQAEDLVDYVDATHRTVIIEPGVTVDDWLVFNDYQHDREVTVLDLTFGGDAAINGNLRLTTVTPEDPSGDDDRLANNLQSLVITSEGDAGNRITGNIDPTVAVVNTVGGKTTTENNLLNVIINATADFTVDGKVRFNAIGDDVAGSNDDRTATLSVDVASGKTVTLNDLDTDDEDVTALVVNHTGDGALTVGLSTVATLDAADQITINGSATGITTLVVDTYSELSATAGQRLDLSDDNLANVDAIVLADKAELTLSQAQLDAIGGFASLGFAEAGDAGSLDIVGLGSDPFNTTLAPAGLDVGQVTVVQNHGSVTLDAATNLTGVDALVVPEGTTLNLTAAQFQQLLGSGTVLGEGTVNITGLTQADVDAGLDLSGIAADHGTLSFAEDVVFNTTDQLGEFALELADGQMVTLSSQSQADDRAVNGSGATTLVLGFELLDTSTPDTQLGASSYDVAELFVFDRLVEFYNDQNVEELLQGLSSAIPVTVFDANSAPSEMAPAASVTDRVLSIQSGTTVNTQVVFNDLENGVEVATLDLTLKGGSTIDGDIDLSTIEPEPGTATLNYFQSLTLRSEGDTPNRIVGAVQGNGSAPGFAENNLRDITIIASQDLEIGEIEFSSLEDNRTGELNVEVEAGASVVIGDLDSDDDGIDDVEVNHTGDGALTLGLSTVATVDPSDTLVINGSVTGDTTLVIDTWDDASGTAGPVMDLTDDTLVNVDAIVLTDQSELVLTQAQLDGLGGFPGITVEQANDTASVDIVGLGNQPFDASSAAPGIDVGDVTIAGPGNAITLDASTDLTGVDRLIVPEGKVLNLTAAQFQQLAGTGTIVGATASGAATSNYQINITGLTQADVDQGFDLTGISAAGVSLTLGESEVNLDDNTVLGDLDRLEVRVAANQSLGLANAGQASGLNVVGPQDSVVVFMFDDTGLPETGNVGTIDASGYDIDILKAVNTFIDGRNIENLLVNLDSDIELRIFHSPEDLGFVSATQRILVIEAGVTVPDYIVVNDWDTDEEIRTLALTMDGGAEINGDLRLSTVEADSNLIPRYFLTLSILSQGTAANTETGNTYNLIRGDITAQPEPGTPTIENNLRDVVVVAEQDLVVAGDLVFSSVDAARYPSARLTITNVADVTLQQLDVSDDELSALTIDHLGTGTLTVTGASPALFDGDADGDYVEDATGNLETLVLNGTGNIVLGSESGWGITASGLSTLDASGLEGSLNLGELRDVDSVDFTFTAGTGETYLKLAGDSLSAGAEDAGWTFDLSTAPANSVLEVGAVDWVSGALSIDLGDNAQLLISEDTDLSDLDLTILGSGVATDGQIVVADGATLTLTAEQAQMLYDNDLRVFGENGAASTGVVNIVDFGDYDDSAPVDYNFSSVSGDVVGTITLFDDDVTVGAGTDLRAFSVTLDALNGDNDDLSGQTIRFQTEAQAEREIIVNAPAGDSDNTNSSNVVWLFTDALADPIDTSGYDVNIGRLWLNPLLITANGGDIENLYTSLPGSIVRSEFSSIDQLDVLLLSSEVNRTVEFVAFTDLSATGLTFSDQDLGEHLESLTLSLGGEVDLGNVVLGNATDDAIYDPAAIQFETLTIESRRALNTDNPLASEQFVNDNDGTDEQGEYEQPDNLNVVGDISVDNTSSPNTPEFDLLNVVLDTGELSVEGDGSLGAGADLAVGTITFDSEEAGSSASLTVRGANTTTIASLDASDPEIVSLSIVNQGPGALMVTGASPAAAVDNATLTDLSNTESLLIDATGDIVLGTASDFTKPGVASDELSLIDVDGTGNVDLGILAQLDSADFILDATDNSGVVTAFLGDDDSAYTLELAASGTWLFDNSGSSGELRVTLADTATLGAGALTFNNVNLTIDGAIDLTAPVDLTLTDTTIEVPAGSSLTLTAEDASGVTITGGGDVVITNLELTPDADLSGIMTGVDDSGTVTVQVTTTAGTPIEFTGDLGDAAVEITGDGIFDITEGTLGEATLDVDTNATLILTANQADGRSVTGGGTTNVEDLGQVADAADSDIDLSGVDSGTVNIAVDSAVTLNNDADLGDNANRTITVGTGAVLESAGSVISTYFIEGPGTLLIDDENDNGNDAVAPADTPITALLNNVTVDFITLVEGAEVGAITFPVLGTNQTVTMTAVQADGQIITGLGDVVVNRLGEEPTDLSLITSTGDQTAFVPEDAELDATTNLGTFDVVLQDTAGTPVSLTLSATQANGRSITDSADNGEVNVTALETLLTADLSAIVAATETATIDIEGDVTFTGNLGSNMEVNVSDSDTGTANTLTFDGGMVSGSTTFNLNSDGVTLLLEYTDADQLTVNDNADNTAVIVDLPDDGSNLLFDFSDIAADTLTANVTGDTSLDPASDFGDFAVALGDGAALDTLTLTVDQLLDTGVEDFTGAGDGSSGPDLLYVTDYSGEDIQSQDLGTGVEIRNLSIVDDDGDGVVTVDANADFSRVQRIEIPTGVTLNMTADQFQQLDGGAPGADTVIGDGTLNLTAFDNDNSDIDLSTVTAAAGIISLDGSASSVVLDAEAILDGNTSTFSPNPFSFELTATGQNLTLSNAVQADGRVVDGSGFDNTILTLGFTEALDETGTPLGSPDLDASGFDVENVWVVSEYLYNEYSLGNQDVELEQMLDGLADQASFNGDTLVVTIKSAATLLLEGYADPNALDTTDRAIVIDSNTTVDASLSFLEDDAVEVSSLSLTLEGGSVLTGNLAIPQSKDPLATLVDSTDAGDPTLPALFKTLVITSEDSTGSATGPNRINGSIFADDESDGPSSESRAETWVLDVTLSASPLASEESIAFDGAFIVLDAGDTDADIAAKLAAASYDHWTAVDLGGGNVEFTYKVAGDFDDSDDAGALAIDDPASVASSTGADNEFVVSSGLTATDFAFSESVAGVHNANENNLYDITINAEHDLVITGELELSYLTRSNTLKTDTVSGTITINGDADVTIGSVNTDDEHVTAVTVTHTGSGTVSAPGTSPGGAFGNTEEATINTLGTVNFGTAGDDDKPGIAGADLSQLNINTDGSSNGTVNLGVIAAIDDDFTLTAGGGTVTATLGVDAGSDGNVTQGGPTLNGGNWSFIGTGADLQLTINDEAVFTSGSLLLQDLTLVIDGAVDLSGVSLQLLGSLAVEVPAGQTLVLDAAQADGLSVTGEGTVQVVGAELDSHDYSGLAVTNLDFSGLTSAENGDVVIDLSAHTGTDFNVIGSNYDDAITTADGNDTISSGDGDDTVDGGAGADSLDGGNNTDTVVYDAADTLVSGGAGVDTLDASGAAAGVTIDLNDTSVFQAFENLVGSDFADTLTGNVDANTIEAGAGDDIINMGLQLNDDDVVDGGEGFDTLNFTDNGNDDGDLDGVSNVERIVLGDAATAITAQESLVAAGETLVIDASAVTSSLLFDGSLETDGDFDITGSQGNDTIIGGNQPNSDTITGGAGDDFLTGNAGNDTFNVDLGNDTITDLSGGDDIIVSAGAAATGYVVGDWTPTAATQNDGTGPVTLILGDIDPDGTVNDPDAFENAGLTIDLSAVTNGSAGFDVMTSGPELDFTLVGSAFENRLLIGGAGAIPTGDYFAVTASSDADFGNFDVVLDESVGLFLTIDQFLATGPEKFSGIDAGSAEELLIIGDYRGEALDSSALGPQVLIGGLILPAEGTAAQPVEITIDPTADLSKVGVISIPEHVTLNMTAAQYEQLMGSVANNGFGTVEGFKIVSQLGNPGVGGTLNITDLTSNESSIDLGLVEDRVSAGTVSLSPSVDSVVLDSDAVLDTDPTNISSGSDTPDDDAFTLVYTADNQSLTLSSEEQADGRPVLSNGLQDTRLILGFTEPDVDGVLDASGYDVENVWLLNEYLENLFVGGYTEFDPGTPLNIEEVLENLPGQVSNLDNVTVTVVDAPEVLGAGLGDPDAIETTARFFTIDANTSLDASVAFQSLDGATPVRDVTVTLEGGSVLTGSLSLPQSFDPAATLENDGELPVFLQSLTIRSINETGDPGTGANTFTFGGIHADNGVDGTESTPESFTLFIDNTLVVDGAGNSTTFNGTTVAFSNGDSAADVAAKLAGVGYLDWTAEATGTNEVTFTRKNAGDVTNVAIGDFTSTAIGSTTGLPNSGADGATALSPITEGVFANEENNLYDVTIEADHPLVINGELEFSYVTRSNSVSSDTVVGTLTINGDADVTIGSVNSDDPHISGVVLQHNGTGTVTAPGTSPGAAVNATNSLAINTSGNVVLGTPGDASKPGVSGDSLSIVDINADGSSGSVNLGEISDISAGNFTLTVGGGSATAVLGADSSPGADGPELNGGTWSFVSDGGTLALTITDEVIFSAGTLVLDGVDLTLQGNIDFSGVDVQGLDNVLVVPEGSSLTLTASQADGRDISGAGTLFVVGDEQDVHDFSKLSVATLDFSGLHSAEGNDLVLDLSAHALDRTVYGAFFEENTITTGTGNDTIYGGEDDDVLNGGEGDDVLYGGEWDDTLDGGAGADRIYGGDDEDTIIYDSADTVVDGGFGVDLLDASAETADLVIDLSSDPTFVDMEDVLGGSGNDTITGAANATSVIDGGLGDDVLTRGSSDDYAEYIIGAGHDTITNLGMDSAYAADEFRVSGTASLTAAGIVKFVADAGTSNTSAGTVTLEASDAGGVIDMTAATGTAGYTLVGGDSTDVLVGSDFADIIVAADDDSIDGGLGADIVRFAQDVVADVEFGSPGLSDGELIAVETVEIINTSDGTYDFSVQTEGLEIVGGGFGDTILGGSGDDSIQGGDGNDSITGGAGADSLEGGAGADTLLGNAGADLLDGGAGRDVLTGGSEADTFRFGLGDSVILIDTGDIDVTAADVIQDFNRVDGDTVELLDKSLENLDVVDGASNGSMAFLANAEAFFGVGDADPDSVDVYIEYNANSSGDAWMLADMNNNGTVDDGDVFVVLVGVDLPTEVPLAPLG